MFPTHVRILIIDDSEAIRGTVKTYFTELGYQLLDEAEDGQAGWDRLVGELSRGNPFGLVICDWKMPRMNGLEVLKAMRSSNDFREIPFIFMSTMSERAQILEALSARANNYLIKPFEKKDLVEKLDSISLRASFSTLGQ